MVIYVPGTEETDPKKQNMSLQQIGGATSANVTSIATNTADIATNTADIAALQAGSATYVVGPASATANGFAVYNGTTGKLIKDHAATISLASEVTGTLPIANGGLGNTAGAWTAWTPTVTPSVGAFTTVSASGAYYVIGKLVHFTVTITITTVGTAAGAMAIALPTGTALRPAVVFAAETAVVGFLGFGRIPTSGTSITSISKYDNTTYIGAGHNVTLTGIYEQA